MNRDRLEKALLIFAIGILAATIFALGGCAGGQNPGGTLSSEILEETGAFKVTADNTSKDSGLMVSGAVTLKEGDVLLVSPDLTKGKLHVKLLDDADNAVFDEDVDGRVLDTYQIDPGEYAISVDCVEGGTTGSLVIAAVNAEEFEQQSDDLVEALTNAGVSNAAAAVGAASDASAASDSADTAAAAADFELDYGTSELYTKDDIDAAVDAIMAEFNTWKGAQMKKLAFTDDATCEDNVAYVNELRDEGADEFDQAIVFTSTFHSPSAKDAENTAWNPDTDYEGWTWFLARTDGGEWELLTWGY